jgi:hypothetical protein
MSKTNPKLDEAILQAILDTAAHDCVTADLDAWVAEIEKMPAPTISPAFDRKMKKLIRGESLSLRKVLITCLLVFCGLFGGALCVEASRVQIFRFFTSVGQGHTDIEVIEDKANTTKPLYVPAYIPEGYFLKEVNPITETFTTMEYSDNNGKVILVEQIIGKASISVDTDHKEQKEVEVRGERALLFIDATGETNNILICNLEGISFSLKGLISEEDLLKMAESLALQQ